MSIEQQSCVEAMKLVRDAIEQGVDLNLIGAKHILDQAIADLEKQEPVAWRYSFTHSSAIGHGDYDIGPLVTDKKDVAFGVGCFGQEPLCTYPYTRQPNIEPKKCGVCAEEEAFTGSCGGGRDNPNALCYTHPPVPAGHEPKRAVSETHKPLTDEQWQIMADTLHCAITRRQKDVIEAALGITKKEL